MSNSKMMATCKCLLIASVIVLLGGLAFLYSGLYPIGADTPHSSMTYWALETLRERSIVRAASDIDVPSDLNTPERLLKGGADYNDMCTGCHLKPGEEKSDFTLGLYPVPPNLSLSGGDHGHENHIESKYVQQRQFWIIKHGIKASGMPAWAPAHDDERIWNMVAFLKRLPQLTIEQYQILTARDNSETEHGH